MTTANIVRSSYMKNKLTTVYDWWNDHPYDR